MPKTNHFKKILSKRRLRGLKLNELHSIIGKIYEVQETLEADLKEKKKKERQLSRKNERLAKKNSKFENVILNTHDLEEQLVVQKAATKDAEDKSAGLEKQLTEQQTATALSEHKALSLEKQLAAKQTALMDCEQKSSGIAELIAKTITVEFEEQVFPINAKSSLSIHKTSDDSLIEVIEFSTAKSDDFAFSNVWMRDYNWNRIALLNITYNEGLASKYGLAASSRPDHFWTDKLQEDWNAIIDDKVYELEHNLYEEDWKNNQDGWSYYTTTPEYFSGSESQYSWTEVLAYRKSGFNSFSIEPQTVLSGDTDYYVSIDQNDFKNAVGEAVSNTKFYFNSSDATILASGNSVDSVATSRALPRMAPLDSDNSANQGFDGLSLDIPEKFNRLEVDIFTNFNPSVDKLQINSDLFGIDGDASFASGRSKRQVKKLARQDFDFLYNDKKGGIYFNENGAENGFGEGGIVAILKGGPTLTPESIDFF